MGFTACLGLAFATRTVFYFKRAAPGLTSFMENNGCSTSPADTLSAGRDWLDRSGHGRSKQEEQIQQYGIDVPTVSVVSIFITAPIGALLIGLCGPRFLQ
ncbi:hypothetical protein SRHO_G00254420 [Serrasalmus rhombeus]